MADNFSDKKPSRRQFLAGAAALGAGSSAAGSLAASGDDPLITEVQEWAQITSTKRFQFNGNNSWNMFAEYILGGPFNEEALAGLAGVSRKISRNQILKR